VHLFHAAKDSKVNMKTSKSRIIRMSLAAAALGLAGAGVQARSIAVDFDGVAFDSNGENFAFADSHFGANATGAVPFALNFGTGAASYDFCFNQNGFVSFVASGAGCAFGASPSGDYVAVFSTALTTGGNTLWSSGLIDTAAPFVAGEAAPAMRFIWDATDGAANPILTELVLIDRGGGSFDLDLRYGSTSFGIDGAPATGQQGLSLGSNLVALVNGPFATATDYTFSFVNGVCATCSVTTPPTTVAEPSGLWLWVLGCAIAMTGITRRRRALTAAH
jgi:hypothetical protein